jgi:hypothetical protein
MNRKNRGSLAISILILVWLCGELSLAAEGEKAYLISVVPQFPPLEIKSDWTPLIVKGGDQ